ncbi:FtsB family cell division protein [Specibacter sp. RAF43]|uniref:FtsB family cell division protein n=1 Tax=Specibacter sp. RAF43 TaxID=3233057 RepID=UPI003F9B295E
MATRRPKVPSAHYTAGTAVPESATAGEPSGHGTTPAPQSGGHRTSGAAKAGRRRVTAGTDTGSFGPGSFGPGVIGRDGAGSAPVPARSFSGRLLVLALAMGVLTIMLTPNVHTFMEQRAEISALKADIAAQQTIRSGIVTELARWDDPAYIRQQARDRVSMLMPGETGYWVYGANGVLPQGQSATTPGIASAKNALAVTTQPWVDGLWDAVQKSAQPAAKESKTKGATTVPTPAPAAK